VSQLARLRDIDAMLAAQFRAAGMADAARYTPPTRGAAAVPCTVFVDRNLEAFGVDSRVWAGSVLITLFRTEIGEVLPQAGGRIDVLTPAGQVSATYTIDQPQPGTDESKVVVLCKEGA
jgi:hypothetical protein